jgi:uncharacterized integral membrane protein
LTVIFFTLSLALFIVIFAVQNPDNVPVRFLNWNLEVSKVALAFLFVFSGAFIMNLWNALAVISARRLFREFSKKITDLEAEVRERDRRVEDLRDRLEQKKDREEKP